MNTRKMDDELTQTDASKTDDELTQNDAEQRKMELLNTKRTFPFMIGMLEFTTFHENY